MGQTTIAQNVRVTVLVNPPLPEESSVFFRGALLWEPKPNTENIIIHDQIIDALYDHHAATLNAGGHPTHSPPRGTHMADYKGKWVNDKLVMDEGVVLQPWDIVFTDGQDPLLVVHPPTEEHGLTAYILADSVHAFVVMG